MIEEDSCFANVQIVRFGEEFIEYEDFYGVEDQIRAITLGYTDR